MIRAVICDIYGTLLEVGPPPPDAEARWTTLWRSAVTAPDPPPTLAGLDEGVRRRIPHHHARGRARGLIQPEVDWPALAVEAFPALHPLSAPERHRFFCEHARLRRTTRLAEGAAACLRAWHAAGMLLGIASNAQACTRQELAEALAAHALDPGLFDAEACFFSYAHGVAKPDPRVFQWLTDRLAARGLTPADTLMVGDRLDTDVAPATAAGWHAWHLGPGPGAHAGDWQALRRWTRTP